MGSVSGCGDLYRSRLSHRTVPHPRRIDQPVGAPRLFAAATHRAWPGCAWPGTGLAEAGVPPIGRVPQNGPDRASVPHPLAAARRAALLLQAAADLADAEAVAANPGEDLADHLRLLLDDLVAGNTAAVVLADIAIAVRRPAEHIHRSLAGGMKFAATASLLDLGSLVFRHHALNLQQQVIFGRHPDRTLQEHDLDTGTVQLIHQQHLVGIVTSQAIR